MKIILAPNNFLDDYVLGTELSKNANISSNAYLFWKNTISAKFQNSRTVFINKKTIPSKFNQALKQCTELNGLVLSNAFCSFTGISNSHLVKSNKSKFYDLVEIKEISGIKFVNLKKFYDDLSLDYNLNLYIEKCKFFSPTPFEKKIKLTDTLCLGYY
ncbi:cysteine permease [Campylobacter pinnipediorum]|uniref:Cysteine permease n=1 Tax=Campylobacter pinnipediorum subsp. pinnipediorum TaxID=1660067 RepID=A0AAX0LAF2_9BACT|nr:cysteine permease [Campylobacter pinnipediorum]AQW80903.1 hypothetical protein CPIN17260_0589 [Campylobacter pinnipediorum subsp. pinnipediorum]AQW82521.1 hypothetical protein CPIN17261_0499 [Campylobacter pinnipediorum subsp. pinnipediorum]AQW84206.1 hypothetical protein CPIN17262_0508 [Campylobacter pinnipediorum subsp. pinnipediorum]AQW85831.1 hypothetical protein CPIN18020_0617 [Campylobacter pinnipediorum subsp. caledonicus]OPA72410.1 cysteine permease [Campylobacter pinnipediorum subs